MLYASTKNREKRTMLTNGQQHGRIPNADNVREYKVTGDNVYDEHLLICLGKADNTHQIDIIRTQSRCVAHCR